VAGEKPSGVQIVMRAESSMNERLKEFAKTEAMPPPKDLTGWRLLPEKYCQPKQSEITNPERKQVNPRSAMTQTQTEPLLIDYLQAAKLLGISKSTLERRVKNKTIPHVKNGSRVGFSVESLKAWIKQQETKAS
jgi:excisionase family DNA binding protein